MVGLPSASGVTGRSSEESRDGETDRASAAIGLAFRLSSALRGLLVGFGRGEGATSVSSSSSGESY